MRSAPDRRKTLVLVDDQTMLLDVLAQSFAGDPDIELVGTAGDVDSALALVREKRPDLVALDMDLGGGGSGFEILRVLRSSSVSSTSSAARVVMVSMFDNPLYRNRAFNLGADAYATKGVRFSTMRSLLLDDASAAAPEDVGKYWRPPRGYAGGGGRDALPGLSERERLVVREIAGGATEKQIGIENGMAVSSVSTYLKRAMRKLGAATRSDLLRLFSPSHL